jgi:hypothetical protein
MAIVFLMNEEIARGMVCFFHQKKHSYLILMFRFLIEIIHLHTYLRYVHRCKLFFT